MINSSSIQLWSSSKETLIAMSAVYAKQLRRPGVYAAAQAVAQGTQGSAKLTDFFLNS